MKLSARNTLKGKVKSISPGAVDSEVVVDLGGGVEITAIITKTSCENLDLREGKAVMAVIKATNVMIGVED